MLNRLRTVEWVGDWDSVFARVMSRRILMREYLRRAGGDQDQDALPADLFGGAYGDEGLAAAGGHDDLGPQADGRELGAGAGGEFLDCAGQGFALMRAQRRSGAGVGAGHVLALFSGSWPWGRETVGVGGGGCGRGRGRGRRAACAIRIRAARRGGPGGGASGRERTTRGRSRLRTRSRRCSRI